ncbi:hypothetical protein NE237_002481 [Protea cynaroides]|uniref:Uncharacterized protein n=1 Tax=Protea cynaroides TaxID=273540 RepID=A0A9Q0KVA0_9MAGN|nr:hypothetical protein NE237_002481 [Protea cynaroides]
MCSIDNCSRPTSSAECSQRHPIRKAGRWSRRRSCIPCRARQLYRRRRKNYVICGILTVPRTSSPYWGRPVVQEDLGGPPWVKPISRTKELQNGGVVTYGDIGGLERTSLITTGRDDAIPIEGKGGNSGGIVEWVVYTDPNHSDFRNLVGPNPEALVTRIARAEETQLILFPAETTIWSSIMDSVVVKVSLEEAVAEAEAMTW